MTAPLTVLHAHSGNLFGGIETMLLALARHPGDLRHGFALCYHERLASELTGAGAPVQPLGEARFSRPWTVMGSRRRLRELFSAVRPSVVICHSPWALALFGPVARSEGIPLVLWAHGRLTGRHWLERLARRTPPAFIICNSQYTREALRRMFPAVEAEVVYPPVAPPAGSSDLNQRAMLRAAHGAGPDRVVIAQVGRLEPGKGHAALLDALALLEGVPAWVAWIVGGAQRESERRYRIQLEQRAHLARVGDRVRFLGERDDVSALLAASDIFCQPNTQPETFGIVFVEALYAGVPVVTSACGGAPEIVVSDCGVLVPPNDAKALSDALGRLIGAAELRRRLGGAGPARAAALCAPDQQAARLAQLLQRVLSSRTPNGIVPP